MNERPKFREGVPNFKVGSFDLDDLPEGPDSDILEWMSKGIRMQPRKAEGAALVRIEQTADSVCQSLFGEADEILERLRLQARVAKLNEAGVVMFTPEGEPMWVTDAKGEYVLDWRRVDGMDVETAIMGLQIAISHGVDEVTKLHGRAAMAWTLKEDEYWDAYRKSLGGTVNDSTAAAMRATKDSRYYYYVVWMIWQRSEKKLEAIKQAKRDLEFMRQRLVKEADTPFPRISPVGRT